MIRTTVLSWHWLWFTWH